MPAPYAASIARWCGCIRTPPSWPISNCDRKVGRSSRSAASAAILSFTVIENAHGCLADGDHRPTLRGTALEGKVKPVVLLLKADSLLAVENRNAHLVAVRRRAVG